MNIPLRVPRSSPCDAPVMTPTPKQAVTPLFMRNGCFPAGTDSGAFQSGFGSTTPLFLRPTHLEPSRRDDAVMT